MPLIYKIEHTGGQRTAVWEVTEDEKTLLEIARLNKTDLHALSLIPNPGRRLEWLAVRVLLREFYTSVPTINYHKNGKPLLADHTDKISISHSGKMVGIVLHSSRNPGIDIELVSPRIFRIAGRFLHEQEKAYLGTQPSADRVSHKALAVAQQLTIIWGAKEVMFKVYEHGEISFKNDFMVNPFTLSSKGALEGVIYKDNSTVSISMEYKNMEDFILVQTNYSNKDR